MKPAHLLAAALTLTAAVASPAAQARDCMIGEVAFFAGNFEVRGWAIADGRSMAISEYSALFSILGTTYGGDGRTTFSLPDLRGRAPIGAGQGTGLSDVRLGQQLGAESVRLKVGADSLPRQAAQPGGSKAGKLPKSDQSIDVRGPELALTPLICVSGIFPSRS